MSTMGVSIIPPHCPTTAGSAVAFDTVTARAAEVVKVPAASRARAASVCGPLPAVRESHVTEYGDVVSSAPSGAPSSRNCTPATPTLSEALADSPGRVIVDLSEVEFIDSTALGVLIEARSKIDNRRAFLLAGPALQTRRALEISGLDRHFTVHDSVSEALLAKV